MYDLLKALSLPPANLVAVIVVGLLLRRRTRRIGTAVAAIGAVLLYLLSTSFVASRLLIAVEAGVDAPQSAGTSSAQPQAIVILSSGYGYVAPAGDTVTVDAMTLERLRQGVRLHRATGLPVLVTGGGAEDDPEPVGALMAKVLRDDFGISPKWIDIRASSTHENAQFSARILKKQGIFTVYLVSQAWHLPRAVAAFEAAGLSPLPMPSTYSRAARPGLRTFLPSAKALQASYNAFHEVLGLAWYRWALFDRV